MNKSCLLSAAMIGTWTLGNLAPLHAQGYPTRTINMIVPFPAGGPSDTVARITAEGMARHLGRNIVIENVSGAGGTLGSTRVAAAAPDGYTILASSMGTIVAAPSFYPELKYDSTMDFEPVGMTADAPAVIAVKNDLPVKSLMEFVAFVKQHGAEVKQAHGDQPPRPGGIRAADALLRGPRAPGPR